MVFGYKSSVLGRFSTIFPSRIFRPFESSDKRPFHINAILISGPLFST